MRTASSDLSPLALLAAGLSLSSDDTIAETDPTPLTDAERSAAYSVRGQIDGFWVATEAINGGVRYTPNVFARPKEDQLTPNGICPVMTLPKELLIHIFYEYVMATQRDPPSYVPRSGCSPFPQLTLSHVCAQWRRIVNNLPELWTIIDTCSLEFVELMLARSVDLPVYLRVKEPQRNSRLTLVDWLTHASLSKDRLKYLEYWHPSSTQEDPIVSLLWFVEHASNLQTFTIYSALPSVLPVVTYQLTETSDPPPVEYLTCYGPRGASSLCSFFARTLTSLHISGFPRTEFSPHIAVAEYMEFTHALQSTTCLTNLELVDMNFGPLSGHVVVITLPNLENLYVKDTTLSIAHILYSLQFPTTTDLLLECTDTSPGQGNALLRQSITHKLKAVHQSDKNPKFSTFEVGYQPRGFVRAWSSTDTSENPLLMLILGGEERTPGPESTLASLIDSVAPSMSTVTKLLVGPWGPAPSTQEELLLNSDGDIWRSLQTHLKNVQEIYWSRTSNHRFHQVFLSPRENPLENGLAFPFLRCLLLRQCVFMHDTCDCGEHPLLSATPGMKAEVYPIDTRIRDLAKLRQQQTEEKLECVKLDGCVCLCSCNLERMKELAKIVHVRQVADTGAAALKM